MGKMQDAEGKGKGVYSCKMTVALIPKATKQTTHYDTPS